MRGAARWTRFLLAAAVGVGAYAAGATEPARAEPSDPTVVCRPDAQQGELRERWGIDVVGLHLTAAGHMVDFRYRIVDPERAAPLLDRKYRAELVDQKTGTVLQVPQAPKIGTLRQNTANPRAGRVAFALFANPQKLVKAGSKVTVRIGECNATNLTVQ